MLHHHTKFGNKMFCASEDIIWTKIDLHFLPSLWPWPWSCNLFVLHRILQLMKLSYQTKVGCKRTSSLENRVDKVMFSIYEPSLWPCLEDNEPIFLHDTPSHGNTPPYQVWLKTSERFRRFGTDKIGHRDSRTDGKADTMIQYFNVSISQYVHFTSLPLAEVFSVEFSAHI